MRIFIRVSILKRIALSLALPFRAGIAEFHPTHRAFTPLSMNNAVNGVAGLLRALDPRRERRGYGIAQYFGNLAEWQGYGAAHCLEGFAKGKKFLLRKLFFIASIFRNGVDSLALPFRAGTREFHPTHRAFTPLLKKEISFVSYLS